MDKKCFIIWSLSLVEWSSDPAEWSIPQRGLIAFQGLDLCWMGSGLPMMHAAPQGQGPPSCQSDGAGGMLPSCTSACISRHLSIPQWSVFGMLFLPPCHLNGLSQVSMAVHVESLSPVLFFSGQAQLHFLWPYQTLCFQNCYPATRGVELDSSFSTSPENNRHNNGAWWGCPPSPSSLPSLPWLRRLSL